MVKMSKDIEEGKFWAFLGVFLLVLGFILVLLAKKDNKYAMYYGKQGLVLFIAYIGVWLIWMVMHMIPILGWIIGIGLWVIFVVLWIIGLVYSLSGEEKDIPLIGEFARKIKV